MEVLFFLKRRTKLIAHFYEQGCLPFLETIRKIKDEETPFEPIYDESGEPSYQDEWDQATTSLQLMGYSAITMLSNALKLYFMTWEKNIWNDGACQKAYPKPFKKHGFLGGYKACYGYVLKTDWSDCPVDFAILEQITLARNDLQHDESLTADKASLTRHHHKRHPNPYFADRKLMDLFKDGDSDPAGFPFFGAYLEITPEKLTHAISQVEALGDWMEERLFDFKYERHPQDESSEEEKFMPETDPIIGTPEFDTWFHGSHAKDGEGNPLMMYHGSQHNFDDFGASLSQGRLGIYFTSNLAIAKSYASRWNDDGYLYSVFLSVKKPYVLTKEDHIYLSKNSAVNNPAERIAFQQKYEQQGYDGFVIVEETGSYTIAPFFDKQVLLIKTSIIPKIQ